MTEFVQPIDKERRCFACGATLLPWQRFFCSTRCAESTPATPELGRRIVAWWGQRRLAKRWRDE